MASFLEDVATDAVIYLPSKAVPALANFVSILLFTRLLPPSGYGTYVIVLVISNISMVLFLSWLRQPLLRYYKDSEQSGSANVLVSTVINAFTATYLLLFVVGYIFVVGSGLTTDYVSATLFLTAMLVLGANGTFSILTALMRSELRTYRYSFFTSLKAIGQVGIGYLLLSYTSLGAIGALLGIAIAGSFFSLIEGVTLVRRGLYSITIFDRDVFKRIAVYGVPFIGSELSNKALSVADNLLLFVLISSSAVGMYGAGYKLIYRPLFLIISLISLAAYPRVVNRFETDRDSAATYISETFRIFSLIAIPATLGIIAVGGDLIHLAVDDTYHDVTIIVPWVAAGSLLYGFGQISTYPLQLQEDTQYLPIVTAVAATVNVALNLLLIPQMGLLGAAVTTLIAYGVYAVLLFVVGQRCLQWTVPVVSIAKVTLSSIGMFALLHINTYPAGRFQRFSVEVGIGILIYCLLLIMFKQKDALRFLRITKSRWDDSVGPP